MSEPTSLNDPSFWLSGKEVAWMLKTHGPTITAWTKEEKDPLPVAEYRRGRRGNKFHPQIVVEWYVRQQMNKTTELPDDDETGAGKIYNFQAEKTRLTKAQADKVELENLQKQGKLAEISVLEEVTSNFAAAVKAALDAIPAELKRKCPYLDQAALYEIETVISELRNGLNVEDIRKASARSGD